MLARTGLCLLAVFAVTFGLCVVQCRVQDTIDDRLWRCDESNPKCGEMDGREMTCWQGYCMPSCDPSAPVDPDKICLTTGALVDRCTPLLAGGGDDCPGELSCYRTDLILNEGICVPFTVCSKDEDCPGQRKVTCATEVLRKQYGSDTDGGAFSPRFDHLHCLQDGCEVGSSCGDDALCLPLEYDRAAIYPDICVPRCDADELCPPNYACARNAISPGANRLCIPGVPGVRCMSDQDCAVGNCLDIGVSFKVCTKKCDDDRACELYSAPPMYFRCLAATAGGTKHCVNTSTLQGFECQDVDGGSDCPPETPLCTRFSPSQRDQGKAECRPRCNDDGTCNSRAGVPHVCLEEWGGGCYPGTFGLPCKASSECQSPLSCKEITLDGFELLKSSEICTVQCDSHADCRQDPENPKSVDRPYAGYCAADGFCRVLLHDFEPCDEGLQCHSGSCEPDPSDPERSYCGKTQ